MIKIFITVLLLALTGFAKEPIKEKSNKESSKKTANHQIDLIFKKYKKAKSVQINVEKIENKKVLGTETKSKALLIYSDGKINFSTESPVKSEIIYNKNIWIVEYPDLELDPKAKRKVTILQAEKIPFLKKMTQILNGSIKLQKEFVISEESPESIVAEVKMAKNENLKKVKVIFDLKNENIKSIQTIDDVDTETSFILTDTLFLKTSFTEKLTFKKQKTDEIFKP